MSIWALIRMCSDRFSVGSSRNRRSAVRMSWTTQLLLLRAPQPVVGWLPEESGSSENGTVKGLARIDGSL